ncbi:phosphatase [Actinomadura atramentaria]|uniref:phosphatase n=1 Tax=Actinomadura atramentaria TaxID=1990 RepID=UPI000361837B|nr:phosphatase [Actinomadura atramentaria]
MAPDRAELRAHLIGTMIAGDVATPRQNNLLHFRRMAGGDPYYQFGLKFDREWTERDVLAVMVERCGVDANPMHLYGDDTIDPDRTLDALEAMGDRIGRAARDRATVVLATGHPATLTPLYEDVARFLAEAGCRVLRPADGWTYQVRDWRGAPEPRRLVYALAGVAMLVDEWGRVQHTHDPDPMEAMLAELAAAGVDDAGKPSVWPDLAIADHGWAGAAGQAGIDTVGFADCNDPALFVGAAEGKIDVVVPLDDGVSPQHYEPMTAYLLACARRAAARG